MLHYSACLCNLNFPSCSFKYIYFILCIVSFNYNISWIMHFLVLFIWCLVGFLYLDGHLFLWGCKFVSYDFTEDIFVDSLSYQSPFYPLVWRLDFHGIPKLSQVLFLFFTSSPWLTLCPLRYHFVFLCDFVYSVIHSVGEAVHCGVSLLLFFAAAVVVLLCFPSSIISV